MAGAEDRPIDEMLVTRLMLMPVCQSICAIGRLYILACFSCDQCRPTPSGGLKNRLRGKLSGPILPVILSIQGRTLRILKFDSNRRCRWDSPHQPLWLYQFSCENLWPTVPHLASDPGTIFPAQRLKKGNPSLPAPIS